MPLDFQRPLPIPSPSAPVEPAFLRQKNAARYVGMSEQGFIKMLRRGEGPPRIKKNRAVYFEIAALRSWMLRDQEPISESRVTTLVKAETDLQATWRPRPKEL
jgi:hypothetical protein